MDGDRGQRRERRRSIGIPGLTLDASSLTLKVNTASGTYGASLDRGARRSTGRRRSTSTRNGHFGQAADQLTVGGTAINLSGALLAATGTAHLNLFGFVDGTVSFSFQQQTVDVDVDGDGDDRHRRRQRQPRSAGLRVRTSQMRRSRRSGSSSRSARA